MHDINTKITFLYLRLLMFSRLDAAEEFSSSEILHCYWATIYPRF